MIYIYIQINLHMIHDTYIDIYVCICIYIYIYMPPNCLLKYRTHKQDAAEKATLSARPVAGLGVCRGYIQDLLPT